MRGTEVPRPHHADHADHADHPEPAADLALGRALLQTARAALADAFALPAPATAPHPALALPGATFVTLTQAGELRGCIGTLEAHRPLGEDVARNAVAAAFRDPRFPPLTVGEYATTRVEVSLLTAPVPLPVRSEADLLARLVPGVDGLVFSWHGHRATFLPQVWDALPEPAAFIGQLKRKAGLAAGFWADDVRIERYTVAKFREPADAPGPPVSCEPASPRGAPTS